MTIQHELIPQASERRDDAGMAHVLAGIAAKVERADVHLAALQHELTEFMNTEPCTIETVPPGDDGWWGGVMRQHRQPPLSIGILVGDIAHNLRSALDHLVHRIVEGLGGEPNGRTCFPIYLDEAKYERAVEVPRQRGKASALLGIDDVTAAMIRSCQPFTAQPRERTALWLLHDLWNTDKHRLVHAGLARVPDASPTVKVIASREPDADIVIETNLTRGPVSDGQVVIRYRLEGFDDDAGLSMHCEVPIDLAVGDEPIFCYQLWDARDNVVSILNDFSHGFA